MEFRTGQFTRRDFAAGNQSLDQTAGGPVEGSFTTHNGEIRIEIGEKVSTELDCRTSHGKISDRLDADEIEHHGRKRLSGTLGEGGGKLDIRNSNGDIVLERPDSESRPRRRR